MVQIEKNIPLDREDGLQRALKEFPFDKMEPGDSFSIHAESDKLLGRMRTYASIYGKQANRKFTVRREQGKTYRCWRIS